jgi:hypothetical protein
VEVCSLVQGWGSHRVAALPYCIWTLQFGSHVTLEVLQSVIQEKQHQNTNQCLCCIVADDVSQYVCRKRPFPLPSDPHIGVYARVFQSLPGTAQPELCRLKKFLFDVWQVRVNHSSDTSLHERTIPVKHGD